MQVIGSSPQLLAIGYRATSSYACTGEYRPRFFPCGDTSYSLFQDRMAEYQSHAPHRCRALAAHLEEYGCLIGFADFLSQKRIEFAFPPVRAPAPIRPIVSPRAPSPRSRISHFGIAPFKTHYIEIGLSSFATLSTSTLMLLVFIS
jgi:hypothetical protein